MNGIENNTIIGLDTNIFIYQFERHPDFFTQVKKVFEKLQSNECSGVTSIVSLIETLSFPMNEEALQRLTQLFLETPNLTIYEIQHTIAIEAARIRRKYNFRLGDAIQLATALYAKADVFVTNDERLKQCKEIKIQLLK